MARIASLAVFQATASPAAIRATDKRSMTTPFYCPESGVPGEHGPGLGRGSGVLPPHAAAVRATVTTHSDLQHCGSPAQRDVGEMPDHGAPGDALLAATMAPVVRFEHATLQHRSMRLDQLPRHGQAQAVELAEGIEIGRGEGSVEHVEVFLMASVGTSIIGRPRRLPRHRHADSSYTLICEEPRNQLHPQMR
ncbi:hypothetical protein GCM10010974_08540 [Brevibacterium sediminis]|uniref:Uncharacterized protein n=1 Tax=Brevibacterium sediminis TaxID=1857024 RepID=A0ABQ1LQB4_9MICO|nr:hypothetical protein GCM10010974_08540 [Brevibacterium sediminis]